MKRKRNNYKAEEKVAILKRHLVDKVPISDVCDTYNLSPTVFYRWQKQFFENGATAFETQHKSKKNRQERQIKALEDKLANKNEVVSELMEAHLKLKKVLGRSKRILGPPRYTGQHCRLHQILGNENRNAIKMVC